MRDRLCSRRRLIAIVAICLLLLNIQLVQNWFAVSPPPSKQTIPHALSNSSSSKPYSNGVCSGYPKDADIVIVVKTGATEASRKLPLQLLSFLSCAKDDVLFFSDMAQRIGDLHVYDSLDELTEATKLNNSDFSLYEDQKQYVLDGEDIGDLGHRAQESWAMDKYKNIHTAQKAWKLRPNKSWYFFIDADTYIVWPSLFIWLNQLDKDKKLYLGAEVPSEREPFGHGGSGYALSRGALESLVGTDAKNIAADFEADVRNICCGDIELGKSLSDKGVKVTDAHPMINGEKPRRYKFGPRLWCQPLITAHHIHADEMNDIWQYERGRKYPERPLLFEELFTFYLEPKFPRRRADWASIPVQNRTTVMPAERTNWENLSEDITYQPPNPEDPPKSEKGILDWGTKKDPHLDAYESVEKCIKACKEKPECFQYTYSPLKCQLGRSFRLGSTKAPERGKTWVSGWDLDKIEEFQKENSPCTSVSFETYHQ